MYYKRKQTKPTAFISTAEITNIIFINPEFWGLPFLQSNLSLFSSSGEERLLQAELTDPDVFL